ncbi:hypothetical protein S96127_1902 [Yersinia pestis]|nr:hypothetical protein A8M58_20790 [Yersinia pestis]QOW14206.1 hypothetical protein S96127_1902 [Yersinia pestis]
MLIATATAAVMRFFFVMLVMFICTPFYYVLPSEQANSPLNGILNLRYLGNEPGNVNLTCGDILSMAMVN